MVLKKSAKAENRPTHAHEGGPVAGLSFFQFDNPTNCGIGIICYVLFLRENQITHVSTSASHYILHTHDHAEPFSLYDRIALHAHN